MLLATAYELIRDVCFLILVIWLMYVKAFQQLKLDCAKWTEPIYIDLVRYFLFSSLHLVTYSLKNV